VKVTCPACGERQDDFGLTKFECAGCKATLSTRRASDGPAAADTGGSTPYLGSSSGWLSAGMVAHLTGVIVLLVSLAHHDDGDLWAPSPTGIVVGAILAWLGFLALLVGLTAYGVEQAARSQSP